MRRVFVPEPQAQRGGDGARAWRCSACARWRRWSPSSAASGCPRRRRSPPMSGSAAAVLARRGAARASSTSPTCVGHGRRQVRRRGRRRRWPPPDAVRPQGGRQDQHRRADPVDPARPDRRGVARAHRDPLAGRGARARRRPDHRARRSRAPHHDASKASLDRRRQRAGAPGRDQPGPLRRAVPRRVPAVPRRRHRRAAPAAGERRGHRSRARDESVDAARRAGMVVLACNPCPCGDYRAERRAQPLHLPRAAAPRLPRASSPGPIADRIDIVRHVEPLRPARARPAPPRRDLGRCPGPGRRLPASGSAGRYAELQLAAQRPGARAGAARAVAARAARRGGALDDALYAGRLTRRGAVRVHRLALDRRRPRVGRPVARRRRASTRSTWRCGCARASRCWLATLGRRAG